MLGDWDAGLVRPPMAKIATETRRAASAISNMCMSFVGYCNVGIGREKLRYFRQRQEAEPSTALSNSATRLSGTSPGRADRFRSAYRTSIWAA